MERRTRSDGRPSGRYAIGIDVGTSAVKAAVLTEDGSVVAVASSGYPLRSPVPGFAEQDPDDWWRATGEALDKLYDRVPSMSAENSVIGLTGQMHTSVLRDRQGLVLRPAILWCDARAGDQCRALAERSSAWEAVTGYRPIPAFTSAHLAWVAQNQPEILRRTATVAVPKDDIRWRFGAGWATEPSDASAMNLMDTATDTWSEELVELIGARASVLAPIVPSSAITGTVQASPPMRHSARLLGTPVIAGAGDQAAQAIALGVRAPGSLGISVGTSGVAFQATDAPRPGAFRHALPDRWLALDSTHAAGLAIAWWAQVSGLSYAEFPETPPVGDGPTFLPYLQGVRHGAGVPGTLTDLTASHTRGDIAGAVLEGVALELLRLVRKITVEPLVASLSVGVGGRAAELPALRSLLAAGLDRPVAHSSRGSALGAAVLAAEGAGWTDLVQAAEEATASLDHPEPRLVEHLRTRAHRFEQLLNELAGDGRG